MGVDEFERWWQDRQRGEIERLIASLDPGTEADGPDVCFVRACAELDVALRRAGRHRVGCRAAHRLRVAVVDACRRTGVFDEDRDGSVRLARAAGAAARAMVCDRRVACLDEVLAPFRSELPLLAGA
jgi:hypothetical protein